MYEIILLKYSNLHKSKANGKMDFTIVVVLKACFQCLNVLQYAPEGPVTWYAR